MRAGFMSFGSGLLFAFGLGLSGMTQPAKVVGFLDFAGNWDPSLAFVMLGAIGVHTVLSRFILHRPTPFFANAFSVPTRNDVDPKLIGGAALFGAGWGLGGFCPGPALTSVGTGSFTVLIFVGAMMAGMGLFKLIENIGVPQTVRPNITGSIVDV